MIDFKIIRCDFDNPLHCQAEISLLKEYMADKMGGVKPLNDPENKRLVEGLKNQPNALVLLAFYEKEYVGLTNSFINFGTFRAMKFLNIHDVIVKSSFRGKGIGRKLLEENIRIASQELNCAKITLEVRQDNVIAQKLYNSLGFRETNPSMYFWAKAIR
jgi:ribosomal protein S18 acetylase RimI-like enzyme